MTSENQELLLEYLTELEENRENRPFLDKIYQGSSIKVYDRESVDPDLLTDGDLLGVLSMESIKKALRLMNEDYPRHYKDMVEEQGDAITGDIFFQLCVMGEVVFG